MAVLSLCAHGGVADSVSSSSAVVAQMSGTFLEVANTLLVSFGLSEIFLRKCHWRQICWTLVPLTVLNVLMSARLQNVLGSLSGLVSSGAGDVSAQEPSEPIALAMMLSLSPALQCIFRIAVVLTGFSMLAYVDLRRMRQQGYGPKAFVAELWEALKYVLPVYLFLVMCSSLVCLILATVLEKMGLPESAGEEMIVYGQFYLPLSAVYWIMKKEWIAEDRRSGTPLPTSRPPFGKRLQ